MKRCPKQVIEDYASWSPPQFWAAVSMFSDQFEPGHAAHAEPDEFVWMFAPEFDLQQLAGSRREWIRWSSSEKATWIEDYDPRPKEEMEYYWLSASLYSSVIIVEGTDLEFYVWDGNHRVGVACAAGWLTIPAIVGIRSDRATVFSESRSPTPERRVRVARGERDKNFWRTPRCPRCDLAHANVGLLECHDESPCRRACPTRSGTAWSPYYLDTRRTSHPETRKNLRDFSAGDRSFTHGRPRLLFRLSGLFLGGQKTRCMQLRYQMRSQATSRAGC